MNTMKDINANNIRDRLDELNAQSILVLNTSEKTIICDYMIICTVNSSRQMRFIANTLLQEHSVKRQFNEDDEHSWCLVDLGDVMVHIMTNEARIEINLEELWSNKK